MNGSGRLHGSLSSLNGSGRLHGSLSSLNYDGTPSKSSLAQKPSSDSSSRRGVSRNQTFDSAMSHRQISKMAHYVNLWRDIALDKKNSTRRVRRSASLKVKPPQVGFHPPLTKVAKFDFDGWGDGEDDDDDAGDEDCYHQIYVDVIKFDPRDAPLSLQDETFESQDHNDIPWYEQEYTELDWWEYPDLDEDDEVTARVKDVIRGSLGMGNGSSHSQMSENSMTRWEQKQADRVEAIVFSFVLKVQNRITFTKLQKQQMAAAAKSAMGEVDNNDNEDGMDDVSLGTSSEEEQARLSAPEEEKEESSAEISAEPQNMETPLEDGSSTEISAEPQKMGTPPVAAATGVNEVVADDDNDDDGDQQDKEEQFQHLKQQRILNLQQDQQEAMQQLLNPTATTAEAKITKEDVAKMIIVPLCRKRTPQRHKSTDDSGRSHSVLDDDNVSLHSAVLSTGWNRLNIHNSEMRRYQKVHRRSKKQKRNSTSRLWADDHTVMIDAFKENDDDGKSVASFQSSPAMMEYTKTKQSWLHGTKSFDPLQRSSLKEPKKVFRLTSTATTDADVNANAMEIGDASFSLGLPPAPIKKKKKKKKKKGHLAMFMAKEDLRQDSSSNIFDILEEEEKEERSPHESFSSMDESSGSSSMGDSARESDILQQPALLGTSETMQDSQESLGLLPRSNHNNDNKDEAAVPDLAGSDSSLNVAEESNSSPNMAEESNSSPNAAEESNSSPNVDDESHSVPAVDDDAAKTKEESGAGDYFGSDGTAPTEAAEESNSSLNVAEESHNVPAVDHDAAKTNKESGARDDFGSDGTAPAEAANSLESRKTVESNEPEVPKTDQEMTAIPIDIQSIPSTEAGSSNDPVTPKRQKPKVATLEKTAPTDSAAEIEEPVTPAQQSPKLITKKAKAPPGQDIKLSAHDSTQSQTLAKPTMRERPTRRPSGSGLGLGLNSAQLPATSSQAPAKNDQEDETPKASAQKSQQKKGIYTRRASFSEIEITLPLDDEDSISNSLPKKATGKKATEDPKLRMVMLRHAAVCTSAPCPSDPKCSEMKELLRHMTFCKHKSTVVPCSFPGCHGSKGFLAEMQKTSDILEQQDEFDKDLPPIVAAFHADDDDVSEIESLGPSAHLSKILSNHEKPHEATKGQVQAKAKNGAKDTEQAGAKKPSGGGKHRKGKSEGQVLGLNSEEKNSAAMVDESNSTTKKVRSTLLGFGSLLPSTRLFGKAPEAKQEPVLYSDKVHAGKVDAPLEVERLKAAKLAKKKSKQRRKSLADMEVPVARIATLTKKPLDSKIRERKRRESLADMDIPSKPKRTPTR